MISAETIVENWLKDLGFAIRKSTTYVDSTWLGKPGNIKWLYKEWRFYLHQDLKFTAYNIYNCSYMEVSLVHPESINEISAWIKENKWEGRA